MMYNLFDFIIESCILPIKKKKKKILVTDSQKKCYLLLFYTFSIYIYIYIIFYFLFFIFFIFYFILCKGKDILQFIECDYACLFIQCIQICGSHLPCMGKHELYMVFS